MNSSSSTPAAPPPIAACSTSIVVPLLVLTYTGWNGDWEVLASDQSPWDKEACSSAANLFSKNKDLPLCSLTSAATLLLLI